MGKNNEMNKRIDLLNRDEFIGNVVQVAFQLSENRQGCCFAVEGGWGIGKTFVVEGIEEQLRAAQSEETAHERFFVFHYNCWQHDYYEEPAVAIISAMLASISRDKAMVSEKADRIAKAGYEFAEDKLKEIAGLYLEKKIGVNLIEWIQKISNGQKEEQLSRYAFDERFDFSQTIEEVRKHLAEIAKGRTVVLVVDELDRCIPQYAIKVMERLHHIFYGLENVIVIMAIDKGQLEHSVEKMFGIREGDSQVDVEKYLKKFIDFSMLLNYGKINASLVEKYDFYFDRFTDRIAGDMERVHDILSVLLGGIDIRRQEKVIEKANIIHSIVCHEEKMDLSVLVFEVMYEVLKLKKFTDMEYVVKVNEAKHMEMEKLLGRERMDLLKSMEKEAWHGKMTFMSGNSGGTKKLILFNLYGKTMWYFANIFNGENVPYMSQAAVGENTNKGLEAVRKYCQFGEMIQ